MAPKDKKLEEATAQSVPPVLSPEGQIEAERAYRAARAAERKVKIGKAAVWLALILGSIVFMLPYYIMVTMALKDANEVATTDMWTWPKNLTFANFAEVWTNENVSFLRLIKNTAAITILTTIGVTASSGVVAYAFARLNFAGRDRLFLVLLGTMMLPGIVTMIPSYVMFAKIGWVNTWLPLIVPAFFGSAFFIFLLRQFYLGIPRELDEAALIDGAGHWTIFSRIVVPNSGPALATVALFTFMGTWRDFMGPLLYLNDPDRQTLEIGLRTFMALRAEKWHLMMTASLIVTIPLIIIFFVGQRYFVKVSLMTGLK